MRALGQRVQHIGPFRDVSIDWDALPGLFVAVCGENGAGKSMVLESFPGGIYRTCPTRGPMAKLATSRDAFVENRIVNGAPWTIRLWPVRGEAEVLDAEGRSVLGDRKVTTLDDWVKKTLPPPEVLYSGPFVPQPLAKSKWPMGGFLGMTAGDRKAVLLRALGCERLERMAEAARQRAAAAKARFDVASTRLADERTRGVNLAEAEQAADAARAEIEKADLSDRCATEQLAIVHAEAEAIASRNAERERQLAARAAAKGAADAATARVNALISRSADVRDLLDGADAVRTQAARHAEIEREIAPLRENLASARAEHQAAERRLAELRASAERAAHGDRHAAAKLDEARRAGRAREAAIADAARLPEAQKALAAAIADVAAAEAQLEELRTLQTSGAQTRITDLRGALTFYANPAHHKSGAVREDEGTVAKGALDYDDAVHADVERLPSDLREAQETLRRAAATAAAAQADVTRLDLQRIRAEGPDPVVAATEAAAEAHKAAEAARGDLADAQAHEERLRLNIVDLTATVNAKVSEAGGLQASAARARELDAAAATLAELDAQIVAAKAEEGHARAAIPTEESPPAETLPDVAGAEKVARDTAARVAHARAKYAAAEKELERARASDARLREFDTDAKAAEVDLADWTRLGDDMGRDGLQAAEIDSACPELTAIVNDLLHTCVGPRWTVTFATQRQGDKKIVEGCDVRVLDTLRGRDALAETLSGGEAVIVGEAVSLGLSVLACRRWGVESPTLVRDESGAALSPANAAAYVAMLRRAAAQIGASKVLLVSHSPEVIHLADTRVVVANGEVRIAA